MAQNIEGSTIHPGGDDLTPGGLNNPGGETGTTPIGGMAAPNGGEPKTAPVESAAPAYADGRTAAPLAGRVMVPAEKPKKFTSKDFKRWQPKMRFYLTTLNLVKYLYEVCPVLSPGEQDRTTIAAVQFWKDNEYLCRNYILNGLVDDLYNVYSETSSAKELWDSLEKKYKTEDAGTKKFVAAKFLDFMMVDGKSVVNQLEEFQLILHEVHAEGLVINEPFQVAIVIEKLPPSWTDFKNYLKHKRKAMNMEELMVRLRIEEDNRKKFALSKASKVHLVETSKPKHGKREGALNQREAERENQQVPGNTKDWWMDTGATKHICVDKELFSTYEKKDDGEKVYMANSAPATIEGIEKVILKFTSDRSLSC
ncbi:uncharacterized protein LOC120009402 [Tripterygium wilfordii]|uniref:uncharacterized protein LOC120009402 n=1 Tax=Tripterygium wilfordii TaxID=458696 RepID=UPI0018F85FA4|nr:uncharacterized protein LOC120009402 [Tripterygium wilfordii]